MFQIISNAEDSIVQGGGMIHIFEVVSMGIGVKCLLECIQL